MCRLYVVPTPIGNLEDITLRALRILKEVDLILAEDTRTSGNLLKQYEIKKTLIAHHKFNEHKTSEHLAKKIIKEQLSVALITDAGTPGISDPGFMLIRACIEAGVDVECLPGPTAFVPALVASGLPTDHFVFEGFLPEKKGRKTRFEEIASEPRTSIIYESPMRVLKTLNEIKQYCGEDRPVVAVRELTKIYEEYVRGTVVEVIAHFEEVAPRGEFILILGGSPQNKEPKIHKNKYKE